MSCNDESSILEGQINTSTTRSGFEVDEVQPLISGTIIHDPIEPEEPEEPIDPDEPMGPGMSPHPDGWKIKIIGDMVVTWSGSIGIGTFDTGNSKIDDSIVVDLLRQPSDEEYKMYHYSCKNGIIYFVFDYYTRDYLSDMEITLVYQDKDPTIYHSNGNYLAAYHRYTITVRLFTE